jgi:Crp-like helix-turn-helix domain
MSRRTARQSQSSEPKRHDRSDGDRLDLTHEFLSVMLGTHRPGVTLAVQELEQQGLGGSEHRRFSPPPAVEPAAGANP